jgi:hypothetical protein
VRAPATTTLLCTCLGIVSACAATSSSTRATSSTPDADAPRVLVADVRWLTEQGPDAMTVEPLRALESARARSAVTVLASDADASDACAEDIGCVRALGRTVNATHVLVVELAGLGQTMVVRVRLIETERDGSDVARQRVIEDVTLERLEETLTAMGDELVAPFMRAEVEPRAWYERGYVYALGAGFVAAAVGTGIGVHRYRERRPDVVIVPP